MPKNRGLAAAKPLFAGINVVYASVRASRRTSRAKLRDTSTKRRIFCNSCSEKNAGNIPGKCGVLVNS